MKSVVYYECEFCGAHSKHAPYIKGHEKHCWMSPAMRACKGCRWWFKNRPQYGTDFRHTNKKEDFLPFCSHPDEIAEYSLAGSGYFEILRDEPKSNCEGWAPIDPADMEERKRLKTENRRQHKEVCRLEWEAERKEMAALGIDI